MTRTGQPPLLGAGRSTLFTRRGVPAAPSSDGVWLWVYQVGVVGEMLLPALAEAPCPAAPGTAGRWRGA
ncbi:MAG: hypothetical protein KatS3mg111_2118 [Pirellulaceae bacterium]|nr:MAG: hypothetical protein KatS3mg111_2118 [Pirellulaceae bacterium]